MLHLTFVIAVVALIVGAYGFSTVAAVSTTIAKIAFLLVPIVFVVSSTFGLVTRSWDRPV
jgi:uncharacterized membrane protein YtjA (UPF0391 family)